MGARMKPRYNIRLWLDYDGRPEIYVVLGPGMSMTLTGHLDETETAIVDQFSGWFRKWNSSDNI